MWAEVTKRDAVVLTKDITYCQVGAVKEGEITRLMIGMKGWAHRAAVLDVMSQLGKDVAYATGGPHAGYMEGQLGEYCQEFKAIQNN